VHSGISIQNNQGVVSSAHPTTFLVCISLNTVNELLQSDTEIHAIFIFTLLGSVRSEYNLVEMCVVYIALQCLNVLSTTTVYLYTYICSVGISK